MSSVRCECIPASQLGRRERRDARRAAEQPPAERDRGDALADEHHCHERGDDEDERGQVCRAEHVRDRGERAAVGDAPGDELRERHHRGHAEHVQPGQNDRRCDGAEHPPSRMCASHVEHHPQLLDQAPLALRMCHFPPPHRTCPEPGRLGLSDIIVARMAHRLAAAGHTRRGNASAWRSVPQKDPPGRKVAARRSSGWRLPHHFFLPRACVRPYCPPHGATLGRATRQMPTADAMASSCTGTRRMPASRRLANAPNARQRIYPTVLPQHLHGPAPHTPGGALNWRCGRGACP